MSFNKFMYALYLVCIIFALYMILRDDTYDSLCHNYEKFREISTEGKVIDKYIDNRNHNYKIIIIENYNGLKTRLNLSYYWNEGLYDSLKVGSLVKKKAGSSYVLYGSDDLNKRMNTYVACDSLSN